jgi:putative acetyltransferase
MINYREAVVDDAAAYVAHMNRAGGESDFLAFDSDAFYLTEERARDVLDSYIRAENQAFFVASRGNELVGIAMLESSPMPRLRHAAELRIAVARSCWGTGVAKQLMAMTNDSFEESTVLTRLFLQVSTRHERGIALYRRFNFVDEGIKRAAMKVRDNYHDLLMMARLKPY